MPKSDLCLLQELLEWYSGENLSLEEEKAVNIVLRTVALSRELRILQDMDSRKEGSVGIQFQGMSSER